MKLSYKPARPQYNENMETEIRITKLAYGGEGIGLVDGKICFVENALPGEKVLARVMENKPKFLRAKTLKVLEASPSRIVPPCPHIDSCGGCQYQHLDYAEELRWKETQVREYLSRNLKIDPALIAAIRESASPFGYRNSVTLHYERGRAGFYGKDNKTLVPVEGCLLAAPGLASVFREKAAGGNNVSYRLSKDGHLYTSAENSFFEIQTGGETVLTHSKSFFQNNLEVTAAVGKEIKAWAAEKKRETFVDLYAGAGTFTFLAAPKGAELVFAEESPWGLAALEKNIEARRLKASVLKGKVEKTFPQWLENSGPGKKLVAADPPRSGMEPIVAKKLAGDPRVVNLAYLSCHLGSLTRDLGVLLKSGRLRTERIVPFDMFPRTKHIEILALLSAAD